jgi:hypothetical protein
MSRSNLRLAILFSVLGPVLSAGCFTKLDPSTLTCTSNDHCPSGYVCTGVPGKCQRPVVPIDGGGADLGTSVSDVPGIQREDGPMASIPLDATLALDTPFVLDTTLDSPPDAPLSAPDATLDLPPDGPWSAHDTGLEVGIDLSPPKAQGDPCTSIGECQAGLICTDGVCCDKLCTGCYACSADLNGKRNGSCLPVPLGQNAHSACTASSTICGLDGTCDGNGSCRYMAKGTPCGSTCTGQTLTVKDCDGAGSCAAEPAMACSGSLICANTTSCKSSCASNADCVTGNCTASGTCGEQKLGHGAVCSGGSECVSGSCVGSRCCTSSSCPACQDCSGAGGTCAMIAGSDGQSCGTNMYCKGGACGACTPNVSCSTGNVCETGSTSCSSGRSVCVKSGNNTGAQCAAQSCSGGIQYNAASCTSSGTCPTVTTTSCPYGCNGSSCQTLKPNGTVCSASSECQSGGCVYQVSAGNYVCGSCGTLNAQCCMNDECRSGFYCDSQTSCKAKKNLSESCGGSPECLSGYCSMANYCVSSCGVSAGEICCAGGNCSGGLYCVNPTGVGWFCLPCGVSGSQCCTAPAQACNTGLTCTDAFCR